MEPCPTVNAQLSSFARTSAAGLRMAEAAVVVMKVLLLLLGSVHDLAIVQSIEAAMIMIFYLMRL